MGQIAELLAKYANLRELVGAFASIDCSDPARSMLEQGFAECYDALKVTWIPCERRMPDTPRDVWVFPFEDVDDAGFAPIASWSIDEWWGDDRPLENPGFTHWAEIRFPEPPQKEGDSVHAGGTCHQLRS